MTNLNPFTIIDDILADYASPRARRLVHSLILLTVVIVAIWTAAEGDWVEFFIALGTTLYAAANKANTQPIDESEFETYHEDEPDPEAEAEDWG